MGMYGNLRRASADDVVRLRANPALVTSFMFGEEPDVVVEQPRDLIGSLLRFTPLSVKRVPPPEDPARPRTPVWPTPAPGEDLDLEKAWHGLHFLFTGTADGGPEPACFLLAGGEDVGTDRYGDPVARLLVPEQVRDFSAFLDTLSDDELRRRFDPDRMTELEIYPDEIWNRPVEEDDSLGYLLSAFAELKIFAAAAAAKGDAVLVSVS